MAYGRVNSILKKTKSRPSLFLKWYQRQLTSNIDNSQQLITSKNSVALMNNNYVLVYRLDGTTVDSGGFYSAGSKIGCSKGDGDYIIFNINSKTLFDLYWNTGTVLHSEQLKNEVVALTGYPYKNTDEFIICAQELNGYTIKKCFFNGSRLASEMLVTLVEKPVLVKSIDDKIIVFTLNEYYLINVEEKKVIWRNTHKFGLPKECCILNKEYILVRSGNYIHKLRIVEGGLIVSKYISGMTKMVSENDKNILICTEKTENQTTTNFINKLNSSFEEVWTSKVQITDWNGVKDGVVKDMDYVFNEGLFAKCNYSDGSRTLDLYYTDIETPVY